MASATDVLRALLVYVRDGGSFRVLGMWAVLHGVGDLSATAWRKRLRQASPWLLGVRGERLAASIPLAGATASHGRRVLLIAAARVRQVGGGGDDWRLHRAYDWTAGRVSHVHVTDQHTAEGLGHFAVPAGDILVTERGYGYRRHVASALAAKANLITRVWLPSFPLEQADGTPFWRSTGC